MHVPVHVQGERITVPLHQGTQGLLVARDPALFAASYHTTLVKSYIMLYAVTENGDVHIAHVFHQSQDYASLVTEIQ